jgi:SAM-dependent methyltransferase
MELNRKLKKLRELHQKMGTRKLAVYLARRLFVRTWKSGLFLVQEDCTNDPYHQIFREFVEKANQIPDCHLLELGSRKVTANDPRQQFPNLSRYVGLDIHAGENVDVVGDIHQLSEYFPEASFDAVFSISVFEHLAMPWKAVLEINSILKEGGILFIATHPTWPPHELPWDFFRFNEGAFRAMLNPTTGFEIIHCSQGIPCRVLPMVTEKLIQGLIYEDAYLGVSVLARKIGTPDPRLQWNITTRDILSDMYPSPSSP